jgi:hypothetical protein
MEDRIKQLSSNNLQILFSEILLKDRETAQQLVKGTGILTQQNPGEFKLKFIVNWRDSKAFEGSSSYRKFEDEEGYYYLECTDDYGENWILETFGLYISIGQVQNTVLSYETEVNRIVNIRQTEDDKTKINLYFDLHYEFPINRINKFRISKNGKYHRTQYLHEIKFASQLISIHSFKNSDYWTISFEIQFYKPFIETRILESLQFICGQHLELLGRDVFHNKSRERVLFPRNRNFSSSKFFPPLLLSNYPISYYDKSWKLFVAFLTYILPHEKETFSPLGTEINGAIGIGEFFYETSILVLSIRIEGILNVLYPSLGKPNKNQRNKIDTLKKYIENYHDESLKARLLGSINSMYSSRAKDKLLKLLKYGVINKAHFDSWSELRNKGAHASREKDHNWQIHLRKQHSLLIELYYRIIFNAIGYRDVYTNFNSGDYEIIKYRRYK